MMNNKVVVIVDFDENVFHYIRSGSTEMVSPYRCDQFESNTL